MPCPCQGALLDVDATSSRREVNDLRSVEIDGLQESSCEGIVVDWVCAEGDEVREEIGEDVRRDSPGRCGGTDPACRLVHGWLAERWLLSRGRRDQAMLPHVRLDADHDALEVLPDDRAALYVQLRGVLAQDIVVEVASRPGSNHPR
jgi:hypothetical protein